MREFELYGTVDAVICCFDSLNYIFDGENIKKCFAETLVQVEKVIAKYV